MASMAYKCEQTSMWTSLNKAWLWCCTCIISSV